MSSIHPRLTDVSLVICFAASAVLGGLAPSSAQAETLIITGVRLPVTQAEAGSSVAAVTAADIERRGLQFALDAIASAPGVSVNQTGAFGGFAGVRIRGALSEQTVVLIDGAPVNDPTSPGGGYDFSSLDANDIARIEILKGPQSTLWGSDAIGGVINVITKPPAPGLGGSAFAELGAFATGRAGLAVSAGGERGALRLSATGFQSDGISKADARFGARETDGLDASTLAARGRVRLGGDAVLEASVRTSEVRTEFDSFDFTAPGFVADGDEVSDTRQSSGTVRLIAPQFGGRLESQLSASASEIDRDTFSDGAASFSASGSRVALRYQASVKLTETQRTAFGVEREEVEATGQDARSDAVFALYEVRPSDALILTAGVRRDAPTDLDPETTGRLAALWSPRPGVTLSTTWGQGFKTPTLFQSTFFCCGALAANAALAPERSEAIDAGVAWTRADGGLRLAATVFGQNTDDLIDFSFASGGYLNVARAETRGVEVTGSARLAPWASVSASLTDLTAEDGAGARLVRAPRRMADVTLSLDPQAPWRGALTVRHEGEKLDGGVTLDAWTRVDLAGAVTLTDRLELYGRVENLFDVTYAQVYGYGTPGLSGTIGMRSTF